MRSISSPVFEKLGDLYPPSSQKPRALWQTNLLELGFCFTQAERGLRGVIPGTKPRPNPLARKMGREADLRHMSTEGYFSLLFFPQTALGKPVDFAEPEQFSYCFLKSL